MELLKKTAVEQHKALVNKEVSALELTKASIERIEKLDKELGCFNSTTFESAIETASASDLAKPDLQTLIPYESNTSIDSRVVN